MPDYLLRLRGDEADDIAAALRLLADPPALDAQRYRRLADLIDAAPNAAHTALGAALDHLGDALAALTRLPLAAEHYLAVRDDILAAAAALTPGGMADVTSATQSAQDGPTHSGSPTTGKTAPHDAVRAGTAANGAEAIAQAAYNALTVIAASAMDHHDVYLAARRHLRRAEDGARRLARRIRALHPAQKFAVDVDGEPTHYCVTCTGSVDECLTWPCPTVAALGAPWDNPDWAEEA